MADVICYVFYPTKIYCLFIRQCSQRGRGAPGFFFISIVFNLQLFQQYRLSFSDKTITKQTAEHIMRRAYFKELRV